MNSEEAKALGVEWPDKHPDTGEPFVKAEVRRTRERQVHRYLPPQPPTREVVEEWLDDEPIARRTLTDEEFAAATRSYEAARAEYDRTGGQFATAGPTTTEGRFTCASGAFAFGVWTGSLWTWLEWGKK